MPYDPLIKKEIPLPRDPSNTSEVGDKVEQGVIKIKEGITEQSSQMEDKEERNNSVYETNATD